MNRVTKPAELIELVSVHYNEKISYKVAQLCRLHLLTGGIGQAIQLSIATSLSRRGRVAGYWCNDGSVD